MVQLGVQVSLVVLPYPPYFDGICRIRHPRTHTHTYKQVTDTTYSPKFLADTPTHPLPVLNFLPSFLPL